MDEDERWELTKRRKRVKNRDKESGGEEERNGGKSLKMDSSQSEEHKVVFKLIGEQSGFRSYNPIRLAGALKGELGEILSARILADGRLIVVCKTASQMGKALSIQQIGKKRVEVCAQGSRSSGVKGVIYGVSAEISMEELIREIKEEDISDAVRIKVFRDGEKHETTTVILTFKEGALPERVFVGCLSFKVHPYRRPPLRCYKCQRYGHVAAACRGTRRCGRCGGDHEIFGCKEKEVKCGSCGGGHIAGSWECEQYRQAKRVQQYRDVNKGMSYAEALRRVDKGGETGEVRRGREVPSMVVGVSDESVVVNKENFLVFMVEILSGLKQAKNSSDIVKIVVKAAERVLGIGGVDPAELFGQVFLRERRDNGRCERGRDDVDDC